MGLTILPNHQSPTSHFEGFKVGIVPLDKIERLTPVRSDTTQGVDEIAEALNRGDRGGHLRRPVGVIAGQKPGTFELIFGFRRVRAMRKLGHRDCKAVIFNVREIAEGKYIPEDFSELTVVERFLLAEAVVRRHFSNYVGAHEGREIVPKLMNLGSRTVFRYALNAISTLDRRLLDKFDSGELSPTVAYDLSLLPPDEQAKIATGDMQIPRYSERGSRSIKKRKQERADAITSRRSVSSKSKNCLTLLDQIDTIATAIRGLRGDMQKTTGDLGTHIIDLPELDKKLGLANTLLSQVRLFVKGQ